MVSGEWLAMNPMGVTVRSYQGTDEDALIELWNATMTRDRISTSGFRTRVLLDANFDPHGLVVAEAEGRLRGFVLSLTRQVPLFLQGLEPDQGWITAFGVHPDRRRQGIGRQLFDAALGRLARLRRSRVLLSPYTPNYFIPGVDTDNYPEAVAFLRATGWTTLSTPISMHIDMTGFAVPNEIIELEKRLRDLGITVQPVAASDLPKLMPFIAQEFGWDWFRHAQEYLLELFGKGMNDICVLVATRGDRIVGYCQQKGERFGPFGVAPEWRRKGIGRLLLFHCLAEMATRGFHCAWFLWTGKDAARLYSLAGFNQARQFVVMEKRLWEA